MKQTLLISLLSFIFSAFTFASTETFSDQMAVIGSPSLSSDPCSVIDKKLLRLDEFMMMVNNTSAFHLEEKASAFAVPGITVSNNKKKMLRDAKKKYAEFEAEHQKYGCDTPITVSVNKKTVKQDKSAASTKGTDTESFSDKMAVIGSPALSSNPCSVIDKKLLRLDEFMVMVNNTSAFHLEEKASAFSLPGITVSNNKKKMLRDAKKKYAEYIAEHQKYGCDTPMTVHVENIKPVESATTGLSSKTTALVDVKPVQEDKVKVKVKSTNDDDKEEPVKTTAVPKVTSNYEEKKLKVEEKKEVETKVVDTRTVSQTPTPVSTPNPVDKKVVVTQPVLSTSSSDNCMDIDEKLVKVYEFMIMLNNTSAFHLEEKASALAVPGITVSNNKKKMLRDAKKKRTELLAERQKYGCEISEE